MTRGFRDVRGRKVELEEEEDEEGGGVFPMRALPSTAVIRTSSFRDPTALTAMIHSTPSVFMAKMLAR